MTIQEFYRQLQLKGYSNADIQGAFNDFTLDHTGVTSGELDTHILSCMELDRLAIFKLWYGPVNYVSNWLAARNEFALEQIDYEVEYILTNP
jgi:hypothetical protein